MPKIRRKDRINSKIRDANNDDDLADDMASVVSNASNNSEIRLTDGSDEVDDTAVQENYEDKLKMCIEGLSSKSSKGKVDSMKSLKSGLSKAFSFDFVSNNRITIADGLDRALKKGSNGEQVCAAEAFTVLLLQLACSEVEREEIYKIVNPLLRVILADKSAGIEARTACATALGLCTFMGAEEMTEIKNNMFLLENIFSNAYILNLDCRQAIAPVSASIGTLHNAALAAWTLLLTIISESDLAAYSKVTLPSLVALLSSSCMELRITAGEAIALIYELLDDINEDIANFGDLLSALKKLSTESNKFRAKKDRKVQRSNFRDILNSVETGKFNNHNIKINSKESLDISSWANKIQYDMICHELGSGMNAHLTENYFLRDIFYLGEPSLQNDALASPSAKLGKYLNNIAYKERSKTRSKQRDKKSYYANTD